jgi:hypothetical protein
MTVYQCATHTVRGLQCEFRNKYPFRVFMISMRHCQTPTALRTNSGHSGPARDTQYHQGDLRTSNMAQNLQGVFRKYREHLCPVEVVRISGGTHNQHWTLTTSMGAQDQQYGSG